MKKVLLVVLCSLTLFASSPAFAEKIVLATGEWPPFIGQNLPGKGLHSEIITKIATKMGYEVEFQFMNWKRAYELTKQGKYLASFTWSDTTDRRGEMLYPENELSLSKEVGFYKKSKYPNGLDVSSFDDIKAQGLKPVGVASYWYEKEYKDKGIKAHIVNDANLLWKLVDSGRADICVENVDVGNATIKSVLGEGKEAEFGITAPLKTQKMYLIFSKKHPKSEEIIKKYDAAVKQLKEAGEL